MINDARKQSTDEQDLVIDETPVTSRAQRYATEFKAVNDEMIDLVESCSDDQWQNICSEEGWSVGVLAHHVASALPAFTRLIGQIATDASLAPRISLDQVNQGNAQHAQDYQNVSKAEVRDLLRTHGPALEQALGDLSDEQLAHTSTAFGGYEMSLAQLTERVFIGHSRIHLASMRSTLDE